MKIKDLEKAVLTLNSYHRTVMFILIDIYYNECCCNEGDLGLSDLNQIYNIMKDYERRFEKNERY